MTQRVSWSLLVGCALIVALDASTAWSILTRTFGANLSFAGELELVGDLVPRKPEPTSISDRSLPRRPMSGPASETFQPTASAPTVARNAVRRPSAARPVASAAESVPEVDAASEADSVDVVWAEHPANEPITAR